MKKQCRTILRFNCCALLLVVALGGACNRDTSTNSGDAANAAATPGSANAANAGPGAASSGADDPSKHDAEIAQLEKQAESNPGDHDVQIALSLAYLRRADSFHKMQKLREALRDYQSALRHDPDSEDAQKRVAEISSQLEGQPTGEYGEPAPLPISPGVTTGEEGEGSEAARPSPTREATRKKP